jgi:DNA-binding MarR family transcriptional regulator
MDVDALADRLHSAAIHLLRRVRTEDDASGLSAPQLSALSVLVFGGPRTLGALAAAEQVRPPTMTRLVAELARLGLVTRDADPTDRRRVCVAPTPRARALLVEGRRRRTASLARRLASLAAADRDALLRALPTLEGVVRGGPCPPTPAQAPPSSTSWPAPGTARGGAGAGGAER